MVLQSSALEGRTEDDNNKGETMMETELTEKYLDTHQ